MFPYQRDTIIQKAYSILQPSPLLSNSTEGVAFLRGLQEYMVTEAPASCVQHIEEILHRAKETIDGMMVYLSFLLLLLLAMI